MSNKIQNNLIGCHQNLTYSSKYTIKKVKTIYRDWEKILSNYILNKSQII